LSAGFLRYRSTRGVSLLERILSTLGVDDGGSILYTPRSAARSAPRLFHFALPQGALKQ
jgi:hypothetical protein